MKIAVWQQFSSNHSSSFTVVGEFPTREDAERAANEIRAILKTIADWHEQHPDEIEDYFLENPSPPEKTLAAKYNVEWNGGIDWFWDAKIEIILDRLVFITPGQRPEGGGKPFNQIMNRLGGKGYQEGDVYGDSTGWILFNMTCNAPDESVAIDIYDQYLGFSRRIKRDGTRLFFDRWYFSEDPDFMTWFAELNARGCTQIEYSFNQMEAEQWLKIHDASDFDVLVEILKKSKDLGDRCDAAFVLGEIGDPRAAEPLIEALLSSNGLCRGIIAEALGEIGDKRAIPPLVRLLETADESIKPTIQNALRKLGYTET